LVNALIDYTKELEKKLKKKDRPIATLTIDLELARSERDCEIRQIEELRENK
jgi:hypothetical protein